MPSHQISSATSVLAVEAIEPLLPFWTSIGFEVTVEVPEEDRLGFVILSAGDAQVMLQTLASIRKDEPALAPEAPVPGMIFLQIGDLDAVRSGLVDADIVVHERTAFYGFRECFVRDPGGNVVTLAEQIEPTEESG